jgi:peptidyl-prolyl cis-trans isomerase D
MESNKVNFAYVAGLYSTIKDSDVKTQMRLLISWRKWKYKAEESRE